jgi:N-acetylglucosamine kinase
MLAVFEIGGSRMRVGRAERPGEIVALAELPTPGADRNAFLAALRGLLARVPGAQGVAVSIPGVVDPADGRLMPANIPCLAGSEIEREVSAATGLPVVVANDADCFALAEAVMGAGRGRASVFGIILGTGIGGGLVMDGTLRAGAGEWGHGAVLREGMRILGREVPVAACGCGRTGCLDTLGARGLERMHAAFHGKSASAEAVLAEWRAGEARAAETVAVWIELLAGPLAMVLNATGAEVAPAGGGLAAAEGVVAALDLAVRRGLLRPDRGPVVAAAEIGGEPGMTGASILGFARIGS